MAIWKAFQLYFSSVSFVIMEMCGLFKRLPGLTGNPDKAAILDLNL
jgi:hypothetical protein